MLKEVQNLKNSQSFQTYAEPMYMLLFIFNGFNLVYNSRRHDVISCFIVKQITIHNYPLPVNTYSNLFTWALAYLKKQKYVFEGESQLRNQHKIS